MARTTVDFEFGAAAVAFFNRGWHDARAEMTNSYSIQFFCHPECFYLEIVGVGFLNAV